MTSSATWEWASPEKEKSAVVASASPNVTTRSTKVSALTSAYPDADMSIVKKLLLEEVFTDSAIEAVSPC